MGRRGFLAGRMLVISDIHGCYKEFQELLEKAGYEPASDRLYLLGDYMDRGPQSKDAIEKVMELVDVDGAIALRGNHDQFFLDWLDDPVEGMRRVALNGGLETIESFLGEVDRDAADPDVWRAWAEAIKRDYPDMVDFLRRLPYYREDSGYILVHAGIDPSLADWRNTSKHDLIWMRWPFLDTELSIAETVIHGHTPVINLHGTHDIYYRDDKIGIDGACAYGGQLNALAIEDGEMHEFVVPSKQRGM